MKSSTSSAPLSRQHLALLAMVTSWIVWSFDPILIRLIGNDTPRLIVTSVSCLVGGMFYLPAAIREIGTLARQRRLLLLFAFYILGCTALADFCYVLAIRHMTPGLVSVVLRSQIALTVLAAWWFFAEKITLPVGFGVLVILGAHGFSAIHSWREHAGASSGNVTPFGWFLAFASSILWTAGTIIGKRLLQEMSSAALCGLRMLSAGILTLGISLATVGAGAFAALSGRQWLLIVAKGILGSCIAYGLYLFGLKQVRVTVASAVEQTAPLFTIAMGWILLQEKITLLQMTTTAIVLAGAMVIIFARNDSTSPEDAAPQPDTAA